MGKHAFLIMAYDDELFLKELLLALDNYRNDIYIHIDKRSKINVEGLKRVCKRATVFSIERIKVTWGSEDQINAELGLLRASTAQQQYDYYHLLSGHDFPLVSQEKLYGFFDSHYGIEFIDCRERNPDEILLRIKYYYPFQTLCGGKSLFNRITNKASKMLQGILGIDRTKFEHMQYGYGANWFSITDDLARYTIAQEASIKRNFYKGLCADEMFLQTVWLNAPFYEANRNYRNFEYYSDLEPNYRNALRAVDFSKGDGRSPRVFNEKDYDLLKKSGCIFGRKMDSKNSMELIKKIQNDWGQ